MSALLRPAAAPSRQSAGRERPSLRVLDRLERATPPPGRRDRRRPVVVAWVLLFLVVLGGNVAVQAQTTQGQFELDKLQRVARQRQADYQRLRLQVAQLEAPQRITDRATEMGMIEAAEVTYLPPTPTTASAGPPRSDDGGTTQINEAAQRWATVKPHLDGRP